jgi:hypothetical protein
MASIEQIEMRAHQAQLTTDVASLVDKYRAIFGWDVPEVDEAVSDVLIFTALRRAVSQAEGRGTVDGS